ncbi:MAG: glycosyltransferase family 4 protein [Planctomycetaceae bacterium]|nr:glycosyltransferase family 4 protein [Planctomycetaceae bacterium]
MHTLALPHPAAQAGVVQPAPAARRRVAFITHYAELYGANLSLLNLIEGLGRYGVQPHVISPEQGDLLPELARRGIPAAVLPFEWWVSPRRTVLGATARLLRNVRRLRPLAAQVARWGCDVVYSNSSVFAVGAMAAARLRLPHVWHLREFGWRDYDLLPDFGQHLSRLGFRTADATIFVSHALRRATLGRQPAANLHVIYNGVAPEAAFDERRRAAESLRGRRQPFTFVLVGRFRQSKGQTVAIRAFAQVAARHPAGRLLLVGGAGQTGQQNYFDRCRALADELAVADRVEFWGYVPDPERAFLEADVALMCSRHEAMGRVTAEAMSACRPVIGFDSGGTTELIDPGRTGLLYRGGAEALAACMARYVAAPELAWQHGQAGWHDARRRHSTEAYAAQIHEVLRGIRRPRGV